jgi:predicted enzyme related to lactoylglutathione lyase
MGAQVCMEPMDVPGVGRMAAFNDPQGATISVIQYSGPAA